MMTSAREVLQKISELYIDETRWTQFAFAAVLSSTTLDDDEDEHTFANDYECEPDDVEAKCWCIVGAVKRLVPDNRDLYYATIEALAEAIPNKDYDPESSVTSRCFSYNDSRSRSINDIRLWVEHAKEYAQ
jgi:hypothetical protein